MIKLNILDQSPVFEGQNLETSLLDTIELATFADQHNFSRFWVSEHHNSRSFASASPEIFIPILASKTKKIKVGSAGVLLSHYSPLKIAEQFHLLESIFPKRIDLGIGRASGADIKTLKHLKSGLLNNVDTFREIDRLMSFLSNKSTVKAMPDIDSSPEIWILGTSIESAKYAGERGLPYCFGSFINPSYEFQAIQTYYNHFRESSFLKKPYLNLAVFALLNKSARIAEDAALPVKSWFIQSFLQKKNIRFPQGKEVHLTNKEEMVLEQLLAYAFIGNTDQIMPRIRKKIIDYQLNELTIVTICEDMNLKKESYLEISKSFNLNDNVLTDSPQ